MANVRIQKLEEGLCHERRSWGIDHTLCSHNQLRTRPASIDGAHKGDEKNMTCLVQQNKGCVRMRLLSINTFGRGYMQESRKGYFRTVFAWEEKMDVDWSQGSVGLEF